MLNIFEKSDAKLKKSDGVEGLFISHFHSNSNSIYLKQIHKEVGNNSHNNLTTKMDSHDVYEEEINPMNNIGLKTRNFHDPESENSSAHYADTESTEHVTEEKPPAIDATDRNLNNWFLSPCHLSDTEPHDLRI